MSAQTLVVPTSMPTTMRSPLIGKRSSKTRTIPETHVDQSRRGLRPRQLIAERAQLGNLLIEVARLIEACPPAISGGHFHTSVAAPQKARRLNTDRRQQLGKPS